MNTLREIGEFIGIPQGSLEVLRGGPEALTGGPHERIRLSMASLLVTERERPASMRAIIQALQNLTPITLEGQIVGSRSGEEPFKPVIRLNASGGIPWRTRIEYRLDGKPISGHEVSSSGGDFAPTQLGPGNWQVAVSRIGISNTGFVLLNKILGTITVIARPTPTVTPPPPPPPTISVNSSGSGQGSVFVVSGSGFSPNKDVRIRVVDDAFNERDFHQSADGLGKLNARLTIPCNSGLGLHFSATDGRSNPSDHLTGVLWSNTFNTPCP